jgi:hypothetical protein
VWLGDFDGTVIALEQTRMQAKRDGPVLKELQRSKFPQRFGCILLK